MAITTDQYQELMNFMDGNMSLNEMASFENELTSSPELRAQLDFEQGVRDDISSAKNINGESNDQQNLLAIKKNKYFSIKPPGIKLIAAAIIAIMIIAGAAILLVNKKSVSPSISTTIDTVKTTIKIALAPKVKTTINTDSLFKKYYKKESAPQEYPILLAEAFEGYAKDNYKSLDKLNLAAIPETRSANEVENKNTILLLGNFYKGVAALERKKTSEAIEHFTWIINTSKDAAWKDKAHWYLAMSFLQNKDVGHAEKQLHKISKTGKYSSTAERILKTISSN